MQTNSSSFPDLAVYLVLDSLCDVPFPLAGSPTAQSYILFLGESLQPIPSYTNFLYSICVFDRTGLPWTGEFCSRNDALVPRILYPGWLSLWRPIAPAKETADG